MAPENWESNAKFILAELKRLSQSSEKVTQKLEKLSDSVSEKLGEIEKEIALLKLRAGVWGLLAGAIPVAIMMVAEVILNRK